MTRVSPIREIENNQSQLGGKMSKSDMITCSRPLANSLSMTNGFKTNNSPVHLINPNHSNSKVVVIKSSSSPVPKNRDSLNSPNSPNSKAACSSFSGTTSTLIRVKAQVMTRDDSTGGWLAISGGGLSQVMLIKRSLSSSSSSSSPSHLSPSSPSLETSSSKSHSPINLPPPIMSASNDYEYIIVGTRLSDRNVVLYCTMMKDFVLNKVTPTFVHWITGGIKFGLTFLTATEAMMFDDAVRNAIHQLSMDGRIEQTDDADDESIFMRINLPIAAKSSNCSSRTKSPIKSSSNSNILSQVPPAPRIVSSTSSNSSNSSSRSSEIHFHHHKLSPSSRMSPRSDMVDYREAAIAEKELSNLSSKKGSSSKSDTLDRTVSELHEYSYPVLKCSSKSSPTTSSHSGSESIKKSICDNLKNESKSSKLELRMSQKYPGLHDPHQELQLPSKRRSSSGFRTFWKSIFSSKNNNSNPGDDSSINNNTNWSRTSRTSNSNVRTDSNVSNMVSNKSMPEPRFKMSFSNVTMSNSSNSNQVGILKSPKVNLPPKLMAQCVHCREFYEPIEKSSRTKRSSSNLNSRTSNLNSRSSRTCEGSPSPFLQCINCLTCIDMSHVVLYHCVDKDDHDNDLFNHYSINDDDNVCCMGSSLSYPPSSSHPYYQDQKSKCRKRWLIIILLSIFIPCLMCYPCCKSCHNCARTRSGIFSSPIGCCCLDSCVGGQHEPIEID